MGLVHPTSLAVVTGLDEAVSDLLVWSARDLDASADLDDVIQEAALAQLEADAARGDEARSLRLEAQRHLRRATWQVRLARGRRHRTAWDDWRLQQWAGPDGGLSLAEETTWDDIVRVLGWQDGLSLWLWAVENWSLNEIGELFENTRQQVWRRVRRGQARLRAGLAPRDR